MESRRWLLVLMLWPLPWLQVVKSGFSVQRFSSNKNWGSVVIPTDGVYLVSVIADPCKGCILTVQVSCQCHGGERFIVVAYAEGIYSHAEVAAGLKKNDKLFLKIRGKVEEASSLSVVYVAAPTSFYYTAKNDRRTDRNPITYTTMLTPSGWRDVVHTDRNTTFSVYTTGIYWVTARANPSDKSMVMTVKVRSKELFTVYAEKVKAQSASAAFRLTAGSTIVMIMQVGVEYEPQTLISVVYLAGNKKPNTYPFEHLVFTATYDRTLYSEPRYVMQFKRVLTDYGYMYIDGYTEIRRTGSYMVGIRLDPESSFVRGVVLYVNGAGLWAVYAEDGVPTGVTVSLSLRAGSYLKLVSYIAKDLGRATMYSIAFIQP